MFTTDRKPSTPEALAQDLGKVLKTKPSEVYRVIKIGDRVAQMQETDEHKKFRMEVMKAALRHPLPLKKAAMGTSSNIYGYDLTAPSLHLVPWLTPLRETLPRVSHRQPGIQANWKYIVPSSFTRGGFPAMPWINEGQRAPQQSISALNASAAYASQGVDGAVTYEEESASQDFEDALATAHFFALENLMVKEEDSLIGADKSLKLGTANTPAGTSGTDMYVGVVGLTYEGYRNFTQLGGVSNGLTQNLSLTTADGKPMQINGGCGAPSAISAHLNKADAVTVTPKNGEVAWVWYVGSSNSAAALYIFSVTTVPGLAAAAVGTVPSTGQTFNELSATDYSVNDGTTGGGQNQVTAYDGFLTQAITQSLSNNSYVQQFAGDFLTSNGNGGITEIDDMLESLWTDFKVTVDILWVNAQELRNITAGVLNGSSAPLLRFDKDASGDHYDMTASGTISWYFNPYIPGGKKILVMVHPTLPPGTVLAYAKTLPPYFKQNSTPNVAQVICRRDYYSKDFADTTREYQFGVYCEAVLAVFAPFCLGVLTGIGNGLNVPS